MAETMPDVLVLTFIGSMFCGVVVCGARLLKMCYDKYVLNLPDDQEEPMTPFQNAQGRYAKADVRIVTPTRNTLNFADVVLCKVEDINDDTTTADTIAVEILEPSVISVIA